MIKLSEYLQAIGGSNLTPAIDAESIEITDGYVCDMLSDVMGSAKSGQAWITIMKHLNVVAVASMTGIPAIVFAKGGVPEAPVLEKALEEGICLISSALTPFELAGILYKLLGR